MNGKIQNKKKKVYTILETKLPSHYMHLLKYFILLDKVYCMILRCRLDPTIQSIKKLMPCGNNQKFSLNNILILCSLTTQRQQEELEIKNKFFLSVLSSPKADGTTNLELHYSILKGSSPTQIQTRYNYIKNALIDYLIRQHESFLYSIEYNENENVDGSWDYIRNGWHEDFDINTVKLPDPIKLTYEEEILLNDLNNNNNNINNNHNSNNHNTNHSNNILSANLNFEKLDTGTSSPLRFNNKKKMNEDAIKNSNNNNHDNDNDNEVINYLKTLSFYCDQCVAIKTLPSKTAQFTQGCPPSIHPRVWQCVLNNLGYQQLYTHQHDGIASIASGKHVAISTSTASGKSLIYNLPVLSQIINKGYNYNYNHNSDDNTDRSRKTAMYMFPTKALAQDQLRALKELCGLCPSRSCNNNSNNNSNNNKINAQIYVVDGDTAHVDRDAARDEADIILTNPDMLHHTLLSKLLNAFLLLHIINVILK